MPVFQSLQNFRDFGNVPAAAGRFLKKSFLYRSGDLADLGFQDMASLRALKLRTVCDFRTPEEQANRPDRLPENSGIHVITIPLRHQVPGFVRTDFLQCVGHSEKENAYIQAMRTFYKSMALDNHAELRRFFLLLLNPQTYPLLIHCTGGADRTGFMVAMIQLLAGVPRSLIMAEYLASNQVVAPRMQQAMASGLQANPHLTPQQFRPMWEVFPDYLENALEAIFKQYRSLEDYGAAILGVIPFRLEAFREQLCTAQIDPA